jgi:hypothetical protein
VFFSDRGFTGLPQTDAMRGLHLGVCILDASAFPPPATPSTASPWMASSSSLCFKAICVIWSSPEDLLALVALRNNLAG